MIEESVEKQGGLCDNQRKKERIRGTGKMKSVVIYQSKYGATKKYAEWIAEELACDLYEKRAIGPKQLSKYDTIIYGGGLYAGGVSGIDLLQKNFRSLEDKNIILFTCGLADPMDPENVGNIRKGLEKELTPEMEEKIKIFHLRGSIDYGKLGMIHKVMMAMLMKVLKSRDAADLRNEDKEIIKTYGQAVDFTDKATIRPLLDYVGVTEPVTSARMKEIERQAAEAGLSYYQMMENAGTGAATQIAKFESVSGKKVLIACGKGNNGGDGFVVGRKLSESGAKVSLVLTEGEPQTEDAIANYRLCVQAGIDIYRISAESEAIRSEIEAADIFVDAIFGTGFHGALQAHTREITVAINAAKAPVYALDIPSGVNGDSGEADKDSVRADKTIVFHRLKPAHRMPAAVAFCGEVVCISIGIENVI